MSEKLREQFDKHDIGSKGHLNFEEFQTLHAKMGDTGFAQVVVINCEFYFISLWFLVSLILTHFQIKAIFKSKPFSNQVHFASFCLYAPQSVDFFHHPWVCLMEHFIKSYMFYLL